jgi:hypothetical protein
MASAVVDRFALVLGHQEDLLLDIAERRQLVQHWATLAGVMVAGSSVYGAVLGYWRSPQMGAYAAIKLPLLLASTSLVTMTFNWIIAVALGIRVTFLQVSVLTTAALASASLVLLSLSPVALLFTLCAPAPSEHARATHNILFVTHTALIATCGLVGTEALWRFLRSVARSAGEARRAYVAWIAMFAFVGGELGWLLRPFVGSIYFPVVFLRGEALQRNVYEFIWTDILRPGISHLFH